MEPPYGISDGGVQPEPWRIPKLGAGGQGSSNQRSIGQGAFGSTFGEFQTAWASTGIGAGFAQGGWPGRMAPSIHRGMFGGNGWRTGGAY
jgi:hypothetical protein